MLVVQGNLAVTYEKLGQREKAHQMKRDVYFANLKLNGTEHRSTLLAANNYAESLGELERFGEAKSLLRKTTPVARRVLGESSDVTLRMRKAYAKVLFLDSGATLDDLRVAVTTLEDVGRIAQQVLGGSHPFTVHIEGGLRASRAVLRARETPSASA